MRATLSFRPVISNSKGFTLIEFLVIISIIAVLMAVLMPSLRLAKRQAELGICLSNTKNLVLDWYMHISKKL